MSSRRVVSQQLARAAAAAAARCRRSAETTTRGIVSSSSCSTSTTAPSTSSPSSSSSSSSSSFETAFAVATCGNGDHGRLGHGGSCSSLSRFTLVTGGGLAGTLSSLSSSSPAAAAAAASTRPVAVAAGGAHTLVLTADGAVLSFGLNDAGQLGHSEGSGFVTVPMEALVPEEAVGIAAGDRHSLAVGASGRVWAWGAGGGAGAAPGGGGDDAAWPPARLPRLVPGIASASSVAAGSAHSLILCRDLDSSSKGTLYSWGDGSRGALGHAEGAASATGSGFFSFFFPSSSKRRGARGRAAAERAAPRLLRTLAGLDVRAISASGSRSGAVVKEEGAGGSGSGSGGRVLVWGDDGGFRAAVSGVGRAALDSPAPVPGLGGDASFSVSLLALGRSHALAVREGGTPLLSWGDGGDHGALGLPPAPAPAASLPLSSSSPPPSPPSRPPPPPTAVDRPHRVTALDGEGPLRSVSAGWKHSLACCEVSAESAFGRRRGGGGAASSAAAAPSLFSWGWGGSQGSEGPLDPSGTSTGGGQLGTGDDLDRPRPFAVSELVLFKGDDSGGGGGDGDDGGDEREGGGGHGTRKGSSSSSSSRLLLSRWRALQVSAGLNHSAALVEVALDE